VTGPRPSPQWAVAALVAANAVPLVGVLAGGWRTFDLLLLYWLENAVVGAFTLARMLAPAKADARTGRRARSAGARRRRRGGARGRRRGATGEPPAIVAGLILAPLLLAHYGAFWILHGMVLVGLFGGDPTGTPRVAFGADAADLALAALVEAAARLRDGGLAVPVAALVVSHATSFVVQFLRDPAERSLSASTWAVRPYGRVVVLHVALVLGGVAVVALGETLPALVVLVAAKTLIDLRAHRIAHRRQRALAEATAAERPSTPPSAPSGGSGARRGARAPGG
jgi:hypothetical protein